MNDTKGLGAHLHTHKVLAWMANGRGSQTASIRNEKTKLKGARERKRELVSLYRIAKTHTYKQSLDLICSLLGSAYDSISFFLYYFGCVSVCPLHKKCMHKSKLLLLLLVWFLLFFSVCVKLFCSTWNIRLSGAVLMVCACLWLVFDSVRFGSARLNWHGNGITRTINNRYTYNIHNMTECNSAYPTKWQCEKKITTPTTKYRKNSI